MEPLIINIKNWLIKYFIFISLFDEEKIIYSYSDTCSLSWGLVYYTFLALITFPLIIYVWIIRIVFRLRDSVDNFSIVILYYLFILFNIFGAFILLTNNPNSGPILSFNIANILLINGVIIPLWVIVCLVIALAIIKGIGYIGNKFENRRVHKEKESVIKVLYKSYREHWCRPIKYKRE